MFSIFKQIKNIFYKKFRRIYILYKMTEIIDDISESLDELLNEPADSTEKLKLLELVKNGSIRNTAEEFDRG